MFRNVWVCVGVCVHLCLMEPWLIAHPSPASVGGQPGCSSPRSSGQNAGGAQAGDPSVLPHFSAHMDHYPRQGCQAASVTRDRSMSFLPISFQMRSLPLTRSLEPCTEWSLLFSPSCCSHISDFKFLEYAEFFPASEGSSPMLFPP